MLRLLLAFALLGAATAEEKCSNGVLPSMCGGRYCPSEESVCQADACKCQTNFGQAEMLCSSTDDFFASVLNDPKVWSYQAREQSDLPVPCYYLFSHVKTVANKPSVNGQCDIQVQLYNERVLGKMYVGGYEIKITTKNMRFGDKTLIYKVKASGQDGQYCFNMSMSLNGGPFQSNFRNSVNMKIDYSPFTFDVDPASNRVKLQVGYCGLDTNFRPADKALGVLDQKWLPGFAMKLDNDNSPTFHSDNEVVSLPPGKYLDGEAGPDRASTDELIHRAFTSDANALTDMPHHSPKCASVKTALQECPNRDKETTAMTFCRWILDKSLFVKCWSTTVSSGSGETADEPGETNRILDLYEQCISAVCSDNVGECVAFRNRLQNMPITCKSHTENEKLEMSCS